MAAKKKVSDPLACGPILGFHAVTASRRWRLAAGRRLAKLRLEERLEHLRRTREAFLAKKTKHEAA